MCRGQYPKMKKLSRHFWVHTAKRCNCSRFFPLIVCKSDAEIELMFRVQMQNHPATSFVSVFQRSEEREESYHTEV